MIRIFLGKRKSEDYVDYQFLIIDNEIITYKTYEPNKVDCDSFKELEIGSIFIEDKLVDDSSVGEVDIVKSYFDKIKVDSEKALKNYKPSEILNLNKDTIEIFNMPAPSQFKNWLYINASYYLEQFISKVNLNNQKPTKKR